MKIKSKALASLMMLVLCFSFTQSTNTITQLPVALRGSWALVHFFPVKKSPPLSIPNVHLTLEEDGTTNGLLGCNLFRSSCRVYKDSIAFGTIITSRKFCTKEYMDIEDTFRNALAKANRYTIHKDQLILFEHKKKLAQFKKL